MAASALEILHEDASWLAALKPAGLSTQAPPGIDCLELRVRNLLRERADAAGLSAEDIYLGLPHRLDRPVSGLVLFAKTRRAARVISRQFERRRVRKVYWACVQRIVEPPAGTWIDFVRKVPDESRAEIVEATSPAAKQAVLHYRTLGSTPHGSWLEMELETGRMHQIRIQAASRGHPALGDVAYGARTAFGPPTEDERLRTIALHGRSLTFHPPDTQSPLTLTAPLSPAWLELGLPNELATGELPAAT
jgi:23S rRNA pseudouridine1911/1915/1917 synthase